MISGAVNPSRVVALGLLLMLSFFSCGRPEVNSNNPGRIEGQLLVKFKEGVSHQRIQEINEMTGAHVIKVIPGIAVYQLKIPADRTINEMVEAYSGFPEVEYAEPNYQYRTLTPGTSE